jgi:phosphoglycolate phosphatase-like HAD superfamily hydrolase
MSRITYIDGTPNQKRNSLRRAIAEVLRRLSSKPTLDAESKDMLAFIALALREIAEGIDQSATAWEKRDYYLKADQFRREWAWAGAAADRLRAALREERWNDVPVELAQLTPRFADVRIKQLTRPTSLWEGCYNRVMQTAVRK